METYLKGNVLWSYDYELQQAGLTQEVAALFSFMSPVHHHAGQISLTNREILIEGDISKTIPLSIVDQLYLGFDEVFKRSMVKNAGMLWQPLRLCLSDRVGDETIYLIIDHGPLGAKNAAWFNILKELLTD